tara:strand:- start:11748 stop:16097 length:4350 start_codon:yes stop_codon:yes gene_type:complete
MTYNPDHNLNVNDYIKLTRPDGSIVFVKILEVGTLSQGVTNEIKLDLTNYHNNTFLVNWYNCYSFGNGVESNRIRDSFNNQFLKPGVTVSTIFEDYKEERVKNGLIYSGLYNELSNTNNLNQFIQAEKITKNINPVYGSIQKLHTRDTDLITLCEDKIIKILANKDAVFNADGNPQLTANQNVLGQAVPFIGEFGISKNPESFVSQSYRAYFSDKARGAIMRLSKDGLTAISDHGMKNWFRDNLKLSQHVIGSYDDQKDEYNVTLKGFWNNRVEVNTTVSFKENVKGWVSFKSFAPENAISCNNNYYTFRRGEPWIHHVEGAGYGVDESFYNSFYGTHTPSSITTIINNNPEIVKTFHTVNYEGTQSRIDSLLTYDTYLPGTTTVTGTYDNPNYHNLEDKDGWYVEYILTDKQEGSIKEFIEKEGKWFNYIRGKEGTTFNENGIVDISSFNNNNSTFQGLGVLQSTPVARSPEGCTDPTAFNYDAGAVIDDGSCVVVTYGCTDGNADNYDPNANTDDGSCEYLGCTDPTALNYDSNANVNDGSCIAIVYGCMDNTQFNYNPSANVDDGSCIPIIFGCTDSNAMNPCSNNCNTDDGSCIYPVYGCTNPNLCNYDPAANTEDGSCYQCHIPSADNFDAPAGTSPLAGGCTSGNTSFIFGLTCNWCQNIMADNPGVYADSQTTIELEWVEGTTNNPNGWFGHNNDTGPATPGEINIAQILEFNVEVYDNNDTLLTTYIVTNGNLSSGSLNSPGSLRFIVNGLTVDTEYRFKIYPTCVGGTNPPAPADYNGSPYAVIHSTPPTPVYGCTSVSACNYDPLANTDDGSCIMPAGCNDPLYLEYDANVTCHDNTNACQTLIVNGCTDPTAFNYDPNANIDDGSCIATVFGCMNDNPSWDGTMPIAVRRTGPFGSGNSTSPADDGYPDLGQNHASGLGTGYYYNGDGIIPANTTPNAMTISTPVCNHICPSWNATVTTQVNNNGFDSPGGQLSFSMNFSKVPNDKVEMFPSAQLQTLGATSASDVVKSWQGSNSTPITQGNHANWYPRTFDLTSLVAADNTINGQSSGTIVLLNRSNPNANWDSNYIMYQASGNYEDNIQGQCAPSYQIPFEIGCMDPNAYNYCPNCTISDDVNGNTSSCVQAPMGCTNPEAWNYDPVAVVDDGTCNLVQAFNEFVPSASTNYYAHWEKTTGSNGKFIYFGMPSWPGTCSGCTLNLNVQNNIDLSLMNPGNTHVQFVAWVRVTDDAGTPYTHLSVTTSDGWWRLEHNGQATTSNSPAWKPYNAQIPGQKTINHNADYQTWWPNLRLNAPSHWSFNSGLPENVSYASIMFMFTHWGQGGGSGYMKTIPFEARTNNQQGSIKAGTKVELALFPIIDRTKLPTGHPEYAAANTPGNRLTVPAGADVSSNAHYPEQNGTYYAAGPPTFPSSIMSYTFGPSVPNNQPNGDGTFNTNGQAPSE